MSTQPIERRRLPVVRRRRPDARSMLGIGVVFAAVFAAAFMIGHTRSSGGGERLPPSLPAVPTPVPAALPSAPPIPIAVSTRRVEAERRAALAALEAARTRTSTTVAPSVTAGPEQVAPVQPVAPHFSAPSIPTARRPQLHRRRPRPRRPRADRTAGPRAEKPRAGRPSTAPVEMDAPGRVVHPLLVVALILVAAVGYLAGSRRSGGFERRRRPAERLAVAQQRRAPARIPGRLASGGVTALGTRPRAPSVGCARAREGRRRRPADGRAAGRRTGSAAGGVPRAAAPPPARGSRQPRLHAGIPLQRTERAGLRGLARPLRAPGRRRRRPRDRLLRPHPPRPRGTGMRADRGRGRGDRPADLHAHARTDLREGALGSALDARLGAPAYAPSDELGELALCARRGGVGSGRPDVERGCVPGRASGASARVSRGRRAGERAAAGGSDLCGARGGGELGRTHGLPIGARGGAPAEAAVNRALADLVLLGYG